MQGTSSEALECANYEKSVLHRHGPDEGCLCTSTHLCVEYVSDSESVYFYRNGFVKSQAKKNRVLQFL